MTALRVDGRPGPPALWSRRVEWPGLRGPDVLFFLGVSAVVFALFSEVLFRGRVFFERDILIVWASQVESFVRAVASGSWPVWDPTVAFGHPLLANPNTQVFYPPTWLNLVMRPGLEYTVYVIAHAYLGAVGMRRVARRLGLSPAASLLAACLFIASGPFLSFVKVWHHLAGAAWMPWVVLAAENALETLTAPSALLWGACVAVQVFAGSPDLCVYTQLIVLALVARRLELLAPFGAANGRVIRLTVSASLVAGGLAAAQWLPALDVASQGARRDLSSADQVVWSLHPAALPQILLPLSFDDLPRSAWQAPPALGGGYPAVGRLFELWSPFMASAYLGLGAVGLVVAALLGPRRRNLALLLVVFAGGLVLSLGHHTPLHALASRLVPPLRVLRYPSKALALVAFSWALLGGMGLDALREEPALKRRAGAVLAVVLALGWAGLLVSRGPALSSSLRIGPDGPLWADVVRRSGAPLAVSLALASMAVAVLALGSVSRGSVLVFGGLAVLDLVASNRGLNASAERGLFAFRPPILDVIRPVPGGAPSPRVYVWDYVLRVPGQGHPTEGMLGVLMDRRADLPFGLWSALALESYLYPPSFGRWGLAGSYDRDLLGLYPAPLNEMVTALRRAEDTPAALRLLQLGGVDYVVALHEEGQYGLAPVATLPGLFRKPIHVFQVPDALPRTYAVGCAELLPASQALGRILDPTFRIHQEVVLPEGETDSCNGDFAGDSRIVEFRPDRVTLEAHLSAPGWVVLLASYDPGWTAEVDGREARVQPANLVFQGVAVPPGLHRITLAYRPRSVLRGLAVSGVFGIGGLLFALARLAKRSAAGSALGKV